MLPYATKFYMYAYRLTTVVLCSIQSEFLGVTIIQQMRNFHLHLWMDCGCSLQAEYRMLWGKVLVLVIWDPLPSPPNVRWVHQFMGPTASSINISSPNSTSNRTHDSIRSSGPSPPIPARDSPPLLPCDPIPPSSSKTHDLHPPPSNRTCNQPRLSSIITKMQDFIKSKY